MGPGSAVSPACSHPTCLEENTCGVCFCARYVALAVTAGQINRDMLCGGDKGLGE